MYVYVKNVTMQTKGNIKERRLFLEFDKEKVSKIPRVIQEEQHHL